MSDLDVALDRDYVIRQIQQVVRAITKVLTGRPTAVEVSHAEEAIRDAARAALRVDLEILARMTALSAALMLVSPERIHAYAGLLDAEAAIARASGRAAEADRLVHRAEEVRGQAR